MSNSKSNKSGSSGKSKKINKIFGHLIKEVVSPGYCIGCGACAASCTVDAIDIVDSKAKLVGPCVNCNFCYYQCPQTGDFEKLKKIVFGDEYSSMGAGDYREAFSIKSTDPEIQDKCQDGGAVTSLLVSLLDQGLIDSAVVMGEGDEPWKPEPKVVSSKSEIIENPGTIYSPGAGLSGLKEAVDLYSKDKIAVVGTPCQVKALRRMQFDDRAIYHLTDHVELVIGLFCLESYNFELLREFVEDKLDVGMKDVSKFDVKNGKLIIYTEDGKKEEFDVSSSELKEITNKSCKVCPDFSAELADISVGSVGSPDGHSTVMVRTETGLKFFEAYKDKCDMMKIKSLREVEPGISSVEKLSNKKRESSNKELNRLKEEGKPLVPWAKEED